MVSNKTYMIWANEGSCPFFIGNFLTNRTFQIHLGTILSDVFHQEEGVPQGVILSTTLFNVKINDIVKHVDPDVECSLYVNDCYYVKNIPLSMLSKENYIIVSTG